MGVVMPAILLADDHEVVRQGLRTFLEQELPSAIIGEAQSADEVAGQLSVRRWDLLVLDLSMPGRSGLDVLAEVKRTQPSIRVLFLSMYPEAHFAVRVLQAGASGYVSKDSGRDEFIRAVRTVLQGKKYISATLAEAIASGLGGDSTKPPHELLTDREYEVMRAIAAGKSATEIAQALSISVKTVTTHRRRILDKMGMSTNADLTRYVLMNNLP